MALVKFAFFPKILLLFAFFSLLMEMSNSMNSQGKEDNQQATSSGMPSSRRATPSSHRANPSSTHRATPSSSLAHIAPSTHAHIAPSTQAHIAVPSASVRLRGVVICSFIHTFVNLENSLFKITNHTSPYAKLTMTRPVVCGARWVITISAVLQRIWRPQRGNATNNEKCL
jgi:hypothetical protein